jgi:hypothetical protein
MNRKKKKKGARGVGAFWVDKLQLISAQQPKPFSHWKFTSVFVNAQSHLLT